MNDLIRASISDIVRAVEIQRFIDEGVFRCVNDVHEVYDNTEKFLPHRCNDACLSKILDNTLWVRKFDNLKTSLDNTKHHFIGALKLIVIAMF